MTTLILTIDDDSIDPATDDLDVTFAKLGTTAAEMDSDTTGTEQSEGAAPLTVADLQALLDALPADAVDIAGGQSRSDWERGEPCPECDNRTLSVMAASEDLYDSTDGRFQYVRAGDAIGPTLSILCPDCMSRLAHIPYQLLAV